MINNEANVLAIMVQHGFDRKEHLTNPKKGQEVIFFTIFGKQHGYILDNVHNDIYTVRTKKRGDFAISKQQMFASD
jgi:hypothetical protein